MSAATKKSRGQYFTIADELQQFVFDAVRDSFGAGHLLQKFKGVRRRLPKRLHVRRPLQNRPEAALQCAAALLNQEGAEVGRRETVLSRNALSRGPLKRMQQRPHLLEIVIIAHGVVGVLEFFAPVDLEVITGITDIGVYVKDGSEWCPCACSSRDSGTPWDDGEPV